MQKDKKENNRVTFKPPPQLIALLKADRIVSARTVVPDMRMNVHMDLQEIEIQVMEFNRDTPESEHKEIESYALGVRERNLVYKRIWDRIIDTSTKAGFQALVTYILEDFPSEGGCDEKDWVTAYNDFVSTRRTLFRIVHSTNDLENIGKSRSFEHIDERAPIILEVSVNLSKDGKINFLNNKIAEALQGIPAERLRFCPICNHIFWAYRLDQNWCSKKCSDVHFQKQRRADDKKRDAINERRRQNYAHKMANKKDGGK